MRYISVKGLRKNMKIAKTIYSNTGRIILPANTILNDELIYKIRNSGISHLLIHDERTNDLKIEDILTYATKFGILKYLQNMFKKIKEITNYFKGSQPEFTQIKKLMKEIIDIKNIINFSEKMLEEFETITDLDDFITEKEIILTEVYDLDNYLSVHSLNVATLSLVLGKALKLGRGSLILLIASALLKDIGMLLIPEKILNKNDKLSKEEFENIMLHPEYSSQILQACENVTPQIILTINQHHERVKGIGYPNKLKSDEIYHLAKIIAICDVYCALISKRPFRDAFPPHRAIEYILGSAEELFDYELIEKFSRIVPFYPTGTMVELNTGEKGCVVNPNKGLIARPVVRIFYDREGKEVNNLLEYDLSKLEHQTKMITRISDD